MTLLWTIILAKTLGVAEFGEYSYLVALTILLSIFSEAGLSTVVARDIAGARRRLRSLLPTTATATVMLNIAAGGLLVGVDRLHAPGGQHFEYAALIALYLPANGVNNVLAAVLRARNRFTADSLMNLADPALFAILSGLALIAHLGITGVLAAYAGRQYIVLCLYGLIVWRLVAPWGFGLNLTVLRYLRHEGIPLTISGAAAHAYVRVDAVLLSFLATTSAVGLYSIATRFIDALMVLVSAVGVAALPTMAVLASTRLDRLTELTVRIMRLAIVVFALAIIPITIASPWVIRHLFGSEYIASGGVLRVLVFVIPLYAAAQVLRSFLVTVGAQRVLAGIYLIALGSNIFLNILLIPRFGYYGAAFAAVATAALVAAASGVGANRSGLSAMPAPTESAEFHEVLVD